MRTVHSGIAAGSSPRGPGCSVGLARPDATRGRTWLLDQLGQHALHVQVLVRYWLVDFATAKASHHELGFRQFLVENWCMICGMMPVRYRAHCTARLAMNKDALPRAPARREDPHRIGLVEARRERVIHRRGRRSGGSSKPADEAQTRRVDPMLNPKRKARLPCWRRCSRHLDVLPSELGRQQGSRALRLRVQHQGRRAGSALHSAAFDDPPETPLARWSPALGALRRDRCRWRSSTTCWSLGARFIHAMPRCARALLTDRHHPADHAPVSTRMGESEFMMGLAFPSESTQQYRPALHVQGMLAELIQYTKFCRACIRASEADAHPASGVTTPAAMPLWTVRIMYPQDVRADVRIIQVWVRAARCGPLQRRTRGAGSGRCHDRIFQAANGLQERINCSGWPSTPRLLLPAASSSTSAIIGRSGGPPAPSGVSTTRTLTSTGSPAARRSRISRGY